MKVTGCIPSRYASTQLPGKPLCDIGGKPMVVRVVEQAMQARSLDSVIVLTDDERILDTVKNAGYQAAMNLRALCLRPYQIPEWILQLCSSMDSIQPHNAQVVRRERSAA